VRQNQQLVLDNASGSAGRFVAATTFFDAAPAKILHTLAWTYEPQNRRTPSR